jgi:histidinol-phosphatase (PHP family)
MVDGHIHIERGEYTLEWINRFVQRAVEMHVDEIRLLEHNFLFKEFAPMYDSVCAYNDFVNDWFNRVSGTKNYDDYLRLIDKVRGEKWPVRIKFGLEVCYFKEFEDFTAKLIQGKGFDFLLGSIHFVNNFAFDHTAELWAGLDVDEVYRSYFEDSVSLAKSGIFNGIGHPDAIKLFGHKPSFVLTEYYENLATSLAESNMYADENSGVFRRCSDTASLGIDAEFLKILKKHNVRIVTSSDAHRPEDVGDKIQEMERLVAAC